MNSTSLTLRTLLPRLLKLVPQEFQRQGRLLFVVQEENWTNGVRQLWHYPMHVTIWMEVVQEWGKATLAQDSAEYKDIENYLQWATHNTKTVALEMPYFRILEFGHDTTRTRLIVCCQSPGSKTYKVWRTLEVWILLQPSGERIYDIAPCSAKERRLQEWFEKVNGEKTENLLAARRHFEDLKADSDNFSVDV